MKQSAYPFSSNAVGFYGYRGNGKTTYTNPNDSSYLNWRGTDVILSISVECYSGDDMMCTYQNKITTGTHRTYPNGTKNNSNNMSFDPYNLSMHKIGYENNRIPVMKFHVYGAVLTHGNPDQTCIGYYIPIKE